MRLSIRWPMSKRFCNCWSPSFKTRIRPSRQFASLEQQVEMRTDLDSINSTLTAQAATTKTPTTPATAKIANT
jgi:hypothetical protein